VRELERIVEALGGLNRVGPGESQREPEVTPFAMTPERAVALTAAMYGREMMTARRLRRAAAAGAGRAASLPVRLVFMVPAD
jgi:hypothetical protein